MERNSMNFKNEDSLLLTDGVVSYEALRRSCLEAGLDDVGFIEIERPALQNQKLKMMEIFPETRSVICLSVGLNVENARTPARYLNSADIHLTGEVVNMAARSILRKLGRYGIRGVYLTPAFPMDTTRRDDKAVNISHKPLAEEAGLGLMGHSRMILHPRLGAFQMLSAVLIDHEVERYDQKIEKNPCLKCKLCVAACPVGAIAADGSFDGFSCLTHNYREVVINFIDWVDALVVSPDMETYRKRFTDQETVSWWQSLTYGPNYQCNHCQGVCPAGQRNRAEYEDDPKGFFKKVVKPLIDRPQTVYVIEGGPAEQKAAENPNKQIKFVKNLFG